MNKIIKRKLIGSIICFLLGITCLIYLLYNQRSISVRLTSYLSGFSTGIIAVGVVTLMKYIRAINNEKISKELENYNNDERLKAINNEAMAVSFKISIFVEAIISIICAFCSYMEISKYIGLAIAFQSLLYFIIYVAISKKN